MAGKLAAAGFGAVRAPANLGHLATRMTFLARTGGCAAGGVSRRHDS
jgi:hypothetical protein